MGEKLATLGTAATTPPSRQADLVPAARASSAAPWPCYLVDMESDIRIGDELPAEHRGMPVLATLGGFVLLILLFMTVATALVLGMRLLDRVV